MLLESSYHPPDILRFVAEAKDYFLHRCFLFLIFTKNSLSFAGKGGTLFQ